MSKVTPLLKTTNIKEEQKTTIAQKINQPKFSSIKKNNFERNR